jgi:hypothetical protein
VEPVPSVTSARGGKSVKTYTPIIKEFLAQRYPQIKFGVRKMGCSWYEIQFPPVALKTITDADNQLRLYDDLSATLNQLETEYKICCSLS